MGERHRHDERFRKRGKHHIARHFSKDQSEEKGPITVERKNHRIVHPCKAALY